MINIDAFKVEQIREDLCQKSELFQFKNTYSSSYPEIDDLNTSKLWDTLNRGQVNKADNPMAHDRLKLVSNFINDGGKVLDVGFGSGGLETIFFKSYKRSVDWYAVDISPASVKRAAKRFPFAHFQTGNILNLKFGNGFFDFVVALEILEHIRPSQTFMALGEMWRVLKPGGKLVVSVPLNEDLEAMVRDGYNPNAHVRIYTPCVIKCELELSGFSVLQSRELYAFENYYGLKTLVARFVSGLRNTNNIVILAKRTKRV